MGEKESTMDLAWNESGNNRGHKQGSQYILIIRKYCCKLILKAVLERCDFSRFPLNEIVMSYRKVFVLRVIVLALAMVLLYYPINAQNQSINLPPHLVSWWTLDEVLNPAADLIGQHIGIWTNDPIPVSGKVDGALNVHEINNGDGESYITVQNCSDHNFGTNSFTIDCWIKPYEDDEVAKAIIDKREGSSYNAFSGYALYLWKDDNILTMKLGTGNGEIFYNSGLSVPLNQWSFVGAVIDRTNNNLHLFVNNNYVTLDINTFTSSMDNTANLLIGKNHFYDNQGFSGDIDEVEIFDDALSQDDLVTIFNADSLGKTKFLYNQKMHWPQLPQHNSGFSVNATVNSSFPSYIADDFMCTQSGPITDIHFWGHWNGNWTGWGSGGTEVDFFYIAIAEKTINNDVGGILWSNTFPISQFTISNLIWAPPQGWYDPTNYDDNIGEFYLRYDIENIE
jgi:hypothetical protein